MPNEDYYIPPTKKLFENRIIYLQKMELYLKKQRVVTIKELKFIKGKYKELYK